ncbi:GNAT family N-acetyltransferase [Amphibacillus sediminis]|uniref:GNAT family N-acetyltransferase n=1 Tax=Amphibacillus sediminis TaxID=360185 RepID=UPI00082BCB38|nr:GNAT family N-acetyltransferase [Amphibacillus sediminis]
MIRKLTTADDHAVKALIMQKPAENLFIIGDVEAFGYEQSFQELWGDFDQAGQLRAVLLRYEENYIPFSLTEFDAQGFAEIINQSKAKPTLSGLKEITEQVIPYLAIEDSKPRQLYYAKCTNLDAIPQVNTDCVQPLTIADIDKWVDFLTDVPEFADSAISAEAKKRDLEQGVGRVYYIEADQKVISTVSTAAENSKSAMVVAVATAQAYKGQGLATLCLTRLIKDLIAEGKELCLFYDNPVAGKLYKKLGFKDIGYWMLYR